MTAKRNLRIDVDGAASVSAIFDRPAHARSLAVLAHGAGAGMRHPFMEAVAMRLCAAGIGVLRYQFPYMEAERKRPDAPALLQRTVRAAVARGVALAAGLPVVAGGKSLGGRMTSAAAASAPLDGVRGLVFLGFPLHAPGAPGARRADHLAEVSVPMLFVQGTRDALANLDLVRGVCKTLGRRATLHVVDGGDHSFKVLKRSGRSQDAVFDEIAGAVDGWLRALAD